MLSTPERPPKKSWNSSLATSKSCSCPVFTLLTESSVTRGGTGKEEEEEDDSASSKYWHSES